jgi:hypothetical protein
MKLALGFVLAITALRGTTCTGNLTDPYGDNVGTVTAEVRFVNIGQGCWVLSGKYGHRYEPMQLAEEFRQEGLQVKVTYRSRGDVGSVCMLQDVIEILEIEAVESSTAR